MVFSMNAKKVSLLSALSANVSVQRHVRPSVLHKCEWQKLKIMYELVNDTKCFPCYTCDMAVMNLILKCYAIYHIHKK